MIRCILRGARDSPRRGKQWHRRNLLHGDPGNHRLLNSACSKRHVSNPDGVRSSRQTALNRETGSSLQWSVSKPRIARFANEAGIH